MIHFHDWKVLKEDAKGFREKQAGQWGSAIIVDGTVYKCRKCPKMILEPKDLKLNTVEVTIDVKD